MIQKITKFFKYIFGNGSAIPGIKYWPLEISKIDMSNLQPQYKPIYELIKEQVAHNQKEDPLTIASYYVPSEDEIKIIDISSAIDYVGGELFPIKFCPRPDLGVPYVYWIVVCSIQEWDEVLSGKLKLPDGWENYKKVEL